MRRFILMAGGVELLLLAFGILKLCLRGIKGDAAGQGMTLAYVIIGTLASVLLLAPSMALAYYGKWLGLALILALLAGIFALVVAVIAMAE
jgi:hypothetical protein